MGIKSKFFVVPVLVAVLLAGACSSSSEENTPEPTSTTAHATTTTTARVISTSTPTAAPEEAERITIVLPFIASNGGGTVEISGSSPIVVWVGSLPGEVSLDLVDADIDDVASVVEELVSFWFFQDENSGDVPPTIVVSADGMVSDSLGTRYVVKAASFPVAPTAEAKTETALPSTSTTTTSTTSTTEPPEADPEPSVTYTSEASATTTTSTTTTTTEPPPEEPELPAFLQVQVLNGSGVAGAAGRMTSRLAEAGYVMLPAGNAPRRYSSSAVYYAEGWEEDAQQILEEAGLEEVEAVTAMPDIFAAENAAVVILLGTDTAPAVAQEQAGLRPRQRNDVTLPLGPEVPRDRYVPGLAHVNIYSEINDQGPLEVQAKLEELSIYVRNAANYLTFTNRAYSRDVQRSDEDRNTTMRLIEATLLWLGFTPQNVCGAPEGYSFTDLLKPTRKYDERTSMWSGDPIRTTDELIELHGGERISPEENLDSFLREAAQTAHDVWRLYELLEETEAVQLILCWGWKSPSGMFGDYANALWHRKFLPGLHPAESLFSQGTYHIRYISENGNRVGGYLCHPTLGEHSFVGYWRVGGYRVQFTNERKYAGCQASYNEYNRSGIPFQEEMIVFGFGERVFSASDLLPFPRAQG